jgi:hypothetical protein
MRLFVFLFLGLVSCGKEGANPNNPTPFTPNDITVGNNFAQVEFSEDSRSMTWVEPSGATQKVYYADVNLETGLPDLANKQFIDNIQGQGWPYWSKGSGAPFFLIMNANKEFKVIRRTGTNTLTTTNLGTANSDIKTLINVSNDSSKPYFWISYVVKTTVSGGKDKLYCFRSDNPSNRVFVNEEVPNTAGSAYELTFPRWVKNSEKLLYPFRGDPSIPKFDIKFWTSFYVKPPFLRKKTLPFLGHLKRLHQNFYGANFLWHQMFPSPAVVCTLLLLTILPG